MPMNEVICGYLLTKWMIILLSAHQAYWNGYHVTVQVAVSLTSIQGLPESVQLLSHNLRLFRTTCIFVSLNISSAIIKTTALYFLFTHKK